MEDYCVICGAIVPEGRQVCGACELNIKDKGLVFNPYSKTWTPRPRFKVGDLVAIDFKDNETKENVTYVGSVVVVDQYGTWGQNEEPSYDIFIESEDGSCILKHARQSWVREA